MIFGQEIIATCCGAFRILWKFMHEPTCMEVFEQDPGLLQDQSYTTSACSIAPIRRRTFGHAGSKHALKFHPTNFKIFASTETAFEKQYKSFSNNHFKETVFMKSHHPTVSQNHGGSPKTCFFFWKVSGAWHRTSRLHRRAWRGGREHCRTLWSLGAGVCRVDRVFSHLCDPGTLPTWEFQGLKGWDKPSLAPFF